MPLALFFLGATMAVARAGDALPVMLTVGSVSEVRARPSDSATVTIRLKVARGYHVNANPAASDSYIPLEIVFGDTSFADVGSVRYPKGKTWRLKDSDEDLLVYGGAVKIIVPLAIPKTAQPGAYALHGTVNYQVCDDAVCFMPQSRAVSVKVLVEP